MVKGILEGIRIVEFGMAVVGPLTCSWAGNYGAEVIKVETVTRPDHLRTMNPLKDDKPGINGSYYFSRDNASKYSVTINLRRKGGVKLAKRLIGRSDIVVESYTSGVMEKYGLGFRELEKIKPDIIMLSSCMFGQTGELRSMPGYGVTLTAMSGISYLCGWQDRMPTGPYGSYTDYLVPRFNLLAIVSALDYRSRTGRGIYIDAAQVEAALQFVGPPLLDYQANGRIAERNGNEDPFAVPHGVFPCKGEDRWCAIAVFNEEQWKAFCKAVGSPKWTLDAKFDDFESRKRNEDELNKLVAEWTVGLRAEDVMVLMQGSGVPAAVVNTGKDLENDAQFQHWNYFVELEHPILGQVKYPKHSIEFSNHPQIVMRSPCIGEHTEYVCKKIIGISDEDFKKHLEAGDLS